MITTKEIGLGFVNIVIGLDVGVCQNVWRFDVGDRSVVTSGQGA